ncbi:hypothetical protein CFIMG_007873RA00001c [Ceratocystis fimbriata CBS 114723]|uniref:Protein kinase domain-containing protein n=1 Tax=Ceratocystis fimbriata CBS 114723 TaxID=1035309 RepID=A0A2C5WTU1_9PEZI|nr:hypothetical protein CFIMG_007873RA00001c [Ceratocystis fimbriata CBS 114723]
MENLDFTNVEAVKAAFAAIEKEYEAKIAEVNARIDAEKARGDAAKLRADAENARESLHAHIYHLYAHCFQTLRIRQKGTETTGASTTSVLGRTCPRKLLPWNDFPELHHQKFTNLSNDFDDKLLLPRFRDTRARQWIAQDLVHGSEKESSMFCSLIIENSVARIANAWLQIVSEEMEEVKFRTNTTYINQVCEQVQECQMKGSDGGASGDGCLDISSIGADSPEPVTLVSTSASRGRRPSLDILNARPPPGADGARPIKAQSPERKIKPDGTCARMTNKSPKVKNLLVIEHKPAHVFTPNLLQSVLENIVALGSRIFIELMDLEESALMSGDTEEKKSQQRPYGFKLVAKALVQTYHYMVTLGLSYGYISTGQATILLCIDYKEPSELYFRLCVHQEDVSDIPSRGPEDPPVENSQISSALENGIKNTPYAVLMTMIQLAFDHTNLSVQQIASIQSSLPQYHGSKKPPSDPSSGPGKGHESGGAGSASLRSPCPQLPPPDERSSSQHEQDPSKKHGPHIDSYKNSGAYRPPRVEYCSQQCLLGLANGGYLDKSCPNVDLHRTETALESSAASVYEKHPISLPQLVDIVKAQLDTNLDSDCEVQPDKYGLLGILLKLTAHPYGYTFVGKGMMNLALPFIRHELKVYDQLRPVQGDVVPVCLGHVSMQQTLNYEFRPIRQVLLLSYAGEPVMDLDYDLVRNLESKLLALGVVHDDIREANVTHDVKSGCTMLIDFHRSRTMECPADPLRTGCYEDGAVQKNKGGNAWDDGRPAKRVRLET